jgi:hypothetical protein
LLALADAVFDPGVLAVPQLQPGDLVADDPAGCVGEERGDAVPVDVGEGELSARVRAFLAQDEPRPSGQEDRPIMPVASATQAPSRSPSSSMAGCQH